jgi:hypothetical protein
VRRCKWIVGDDRDRLEQLVDRLAEHR